MLASNSPSVMDATITNPVDISYDLAETRDCCLVQIYPTNIVDGMVKLEKEVLTIGRETTSELALVDGSVSRQHARLERCDAGYWLTDIGSTNGTFVDNVSVAKKLLVGGETIRFGSFIFKFLRASGIEAQYHSTVYNAMTRDGLTGAFNKNYLLDSLAQEISRSQRSQRPLCVMMMDIDYFKKVNDTYGHLVGDEVLREFSNRIQEAKRDDDLLCRYGGEEFVVILDSTQIDQANTIAERCRDNVRSRPFETSTGPIEVTVSIGVAELTKDDGKFGSSSLLERADGHLYRAKQSGRNRVCSDRE